MAWLGSEDVPLERAGVKGMFDRFGQTRASYGELT